MSRCPVYVSDGSQVKPFFHSTSSANRFVPDEGEEPDSALKRFSVPLNGYRLRAVGYVSTNSS